MDELHEQNEDLHEKVDELRDTVRDRNKKVNIDPKDTSKTDSYALYRIKDLHFQIICGQKNYIQRSLKKISDKDILIHTTYNPNPKTMFVRVKEKINEHVHNGDVWIKTRYKRIIIQHEKYENDLMQLVKECDDEREDLNIP